MTQIIAGGYASAGARGLYRLASEGDSLVVGTAPAPIVNVSAGVHVPRTSHWYVADEMAGRVLLVDTADDCRVLASVCAGGEAPCHLALDPGAGLLAVANYESGSLALFRIDPVSGAPVESATVHRNIGHGPNTQRQEGPHAHWVGFRAGSLYLVDLGIDRVLAFSVDPGGTFGTVRVAHAASPGSGPRQLAFHSRAPVAYLVSELASTLTVLDAQADGSMSVRQTLSTLPPDAAGENLGGAIALSQDGTRLYVSNRGHDSVATFALDATGAASPISHAPTGGRSPRFLLLDGAHLFVAHEKSGGVTLLPLDRKGRPSAPTGRADVPGAAFLGVITA